MRLAIAGCTAVVAVAAGLAVSTGRLGSGALAPGQPAGGAAGLAAVAPDVAGRPWLVRRGDDEWVWGRAGQRGRRVLPAGEDGLAIGGGWVASGVSDPGTTLVRVRSLDTGTVVLEHQLDFRVSTAAFAGDRLLLSGYAGGMAALDGGIVALRVPDGDARTIVEAGAFPARLGLRPSKGDLVVSASGRVAAVNACGSKGCDTVVVDLRTLTAGVPQRGTAGFLRAVTDEMIVVTDGDGAWIKGIGVGTGRDGFTIADTSLMEPATMADGRVIATIGGANGWQVAAIAADGRVAPVTDLARAPGPRVWPSVSSPTVAVLGDVTFEDALGSGSDVQNTLIRATDLRQVGTLVVQPAE